MTLRAGREKCVISITLPVTNTGAEGETRVL
jgi:hypothetical protein